MHHKSISIKFKISIKKVVLFLKGSDNSFIGWARAQSDLNTKLRNLK